MNKGTNKLKIPAKIETKFLNGLVGNTFKEKKLRGMSGAKHEENSKAQKKCPGPTDGAREVKICWESKTGIEKPPDKSA